MLKRWIGTILVALLLMPNYINATAEDVEIVRRGWAFPEGITVDGLLNDDASRVSFVYNARLEIHLIDVFMGTKLSDILYEAETLDRIYVGKNIIEPDYVHLFFFGESSLICFTYQPADNVYRVVQDSRLLMQMTWRDVLAENVRTGKWETFYRVSADAVRQAYVLE